MTPKNLPKLESEMQRFEMTEISEMQRFEVQRFERNLPKAHTQCKVRLRIEAQTEEAHSETALTNLLTVKRG